MRAILILMLVALAGCETTVAGKQRQLAGWIGQPVQTFSETFSIMPETVYDTDDGRRTYLFRKPGGWGGSCGVTIRAVRGAGDVATIAEMESSCPPGSL